jgi:hypothetical protein
MTGLPWTLAAGVTDTGGEEVTMPTSAHARRVNGAGVPTTVKRVWVAPRRGGYSAENLNGYASESVMPVPPSGRAAVTAAAVATTTDPAR